MLTLARTGETIMGLFQRLLLALACLSALASCGGGRDQADATAQDAVTTLRARALAAAASSVTPREAARQLMDFGEAKFPQFFPSHQATQSLPPFAYRHYPQTGVYLGVVVSEGQGYEYLGVYVMGGPFGNAPQFVGPLASFITPSEPGNTGPGPTGISNGCYDLMLATQDVAGTRLVEVSRVEFPVGTGTQSYLQTLDLRTLGPATYEGHAAVEYLSRSVQAAFPEGIPDGTADISELHMFQRKTGPAETTFYGSTSQSSWTLSTGGVTTTTSTRGRTVSVPPLVVQDASLPLGGSLNVSTVDHHFTTTTIAVSGQAPITTEDQGQYSLDQTVRFLRRERVTVPAGTFDACVFETTMADAPGVTGTTWVADGKGFTLKTVVASDGGTNATTVTVSISINGQPVTN
ncbi:MAG: hypothetical protein AMXMBFR78_25160 [Rubrivivax sp.]